MQVFTCATQVAWPGRLGRASRSGHVVSVGLHPGLVRTEGVLQFRDNLDFSGSESPEGVGLVVAALAADPERERFNGQVLSVGSLAAEYGLDAT
jgi:dehydrogenase/reductase SDR family protein 1